VDKYGWINQSDRLLKVNIVRDQIYVGEECFQFNENIDELINKMDLS